MADKSKENKSIFDWINSPIVLCFATSLVVGIPAYFGRSLFNSFFRQSDQVQQYKDDKYKKLYELSKPELIALRKSINDFLPLLESENGVSTFELEAPLLNFRKAISSYDTYVSELEYYGNTHHVLAAKEIQVLLHEVHSQFSSQYRLAERVQESMRDMMIGSYKDPAPENPDSYVQFHIDKIQNELDGMIQGENKLYYKYREFHLPIFEILSDQLIYSFRSSIGLGSTNEIAQSYENATKISQLNKNSEYLNSPIPFFVAEQRSILSNDFSAHNDEILNQKNSWLKANMLGRLMNKVGENDPYLKKKKAEDVKNSKSF